MNGPKHRFAAEEKLRRRLAGTLHDDHGQRVAALGFKLEAVRSCLPEDDPRRDDLEEVERQLAELGEDLRRLSHDLHPAILERRGLAVALRDACAEVEGRHGLPIDLDLRAAEHPIPPQLALAVYRIAQEGLANAARHSRAHQVRLALHASSAAVGLSLADDGVGFDLDAACRAGGLGLASMEERARLFGGRCRIVSAPGAGTRIEVSVPRRRLGRWLRRRWGWVTAVGLVFLALSGGLGATLVQARRTAAEAQRAEAAVHFLEDLFRASDPRQARGAPPDARELLARGAERLGGELTDQPLLKARLLDTLGGIHTELGLFDEARPLLEEALALRERLRGPDHLEVAATLVRLGALAHLSGKGEAEPLFRRALAIREARLGSGHAEVADVLNKLGAALAARGRLDEAEAALGRALAIMERQWGEGDLRVAKVLHNLGGIAFYRDRIAEAEKLLERALEIREAALAEDDPDLAGSREALAILLQRQGRPAEAAALLERLVATAERVYGREHPDLGRALFNLGLARQELGEAEAARQCLERAAAITEHALAPDHPLRVRALASLADLHFAQERYAEAEPLYRRLLALREAGAPYDRWESTLANWTQLLRATGRPAEAERAEARAAAR